MELSVRELKQAVRLAEQRERARKHATSISAQLARVLGGNRNGSSNGVIHAKRKVTAKPQPRKLKLSPKDRVRRKNQGRYMSAIRLLQPKQRLAVKEVFVEHGINAALRQAKSYA